jgi:Ca-activated chloride channel homolog
MHTPKKSVLIVVALIAAVSAALVLLGNRTDTQATSTPVAAHSADEVVRLSTRLVQDKILVGSNGTFAMAVALEAIKIPQPSDQPRQPIDLAVVLDRSGSMEGRKLTDARQAIVRMLNWLSPEDRLALIVYDNTVQTLFPLTHLTQSHLSQYASAAERITAGGGTNLGGGLQSGIDALMQVPSEGRQRKVILISDGLANHGITDPVALGHLSAGAAAQRIAVSTVGVGYDFNEFLMTALADHGAGRYHFLENPQAFAQVLEHEFAATRNVAAAGLQIRVPLKHVMRLVDAGGYPIHTEGDVAVIQPGDLLSGEQRRIFMTLQLPADRPHEFSIDGLTVRYQHAGRPRTLISGDTMAVACVVDDKAVLASIDQAAWGSQVVQEDFGRLKESVADAIRRGERQEALTMINDYETHKRAINSTVGSAQVADNLSTDLPAMRQSVEETFSGPPAAVAEKQKKSSKELQYEGYQSRRAKK